MSFVDREDILNVFEDLAKYLFRTILGKEFTEAFPASDGPRLWKSMARTSPTCASA